MPVCPAGEPHVSKCDVAGQCHCTFVSGRLQSPEERQLLASCRSNDGTNKKSVQASGCGGKILNRHRCGLPRFLLNSHCESLTVGVITGAACGGSLLPKGGGKTTPPPYAHGVAPYFQLYGTGQVCNNL